jgi:murein L,D-transpeptidase YafK
MRKSELIQVEGTKKDRGKQKITLIKVINKNMSIKNILENMNSNRIEWRKRIHVADTNSHLLVY